MCLLDPPPLEPAVWQKLADYAAEGHGVAIFLGRNARPVDSFNAPAAQQLLPGKLLRQARRPDGDTVLAPRNFEHPVLAEFPPPGDRHSLGRLSRASAIGNWNRRRRAWAWCCRISTAGRPCWNARWATGRVLTMTTPRVRLAQSATLGTCCRPARRGRS